MTIIKIAAILIGSGLVLYAVFAYVFSRHK
jgi:hypothetical protein